MTQNDAERILELEEAADGVELYRPPGGQLLLEQARDQAEASGWIPEKPEPPHHPRGGLTEARARWAELRSAMHDLEQTVARPAAWRGWREGLSESLDRFDAALERHIREAEGADGLLSRITTHAPHLSFEVHVVEEEHQELRRLMTRSREVLSTDHPPAAGAIRSQVMSLLARLALHRQHGADLVYRAYDLDIAG